MSRDNDSALIVPSYEACSCFSPRAAQVVCANCACCSCTGALGLAAGAVLAPLCIPSTACIFFIMHRGPILVPLAGTGEERVPRGRGAQPPKQFLPRWCFLLTDSACLRQRNIAVGIPDDFSAAVMVMATLQAPVSEPSGYLRGTGFEALVTPTGFE